MGGVYLLERSRTHHGQQQLLRHGKFDHPQLRLITQSSLLLLIMDAVTAYAVGTKLIIFVHFDCSELNGGVCYQMSNNGKKDHYFILG